MFITLLFLFRTYRKPIVILLMLPLIFIGIVLGLILLGKSFDFFSVLGLLGLIGMNIKNAIVLVDQIDIEAASENATECGNQCNNQSYHTCSHGIRNHDSGYVTVAIRRYVRWYGGNNHGWFAGGFSINAVRSSSGILCDT